MQVTYRQRLALKKAQIEDDFEISRSILVQENQRTKENQKITKQSTIQKERLEADISAFEKQNDPAHREKVVSKHSQQYLMQAQKDTDRECKAIEAEFEAKI